MPMKLPIKRKDQDDSRAVTPFEHDMVNLQKTMNRLFDDAWFRFPTGMTSLLDTVSSKLWSPKVDISETKNEYKIQMNVPGVEPDKVEVELDGKTLTVSGRTESEKEEEGETWYRMERESGEFRRSFELPQECDTDKIEASGKNGKLKIVIPKKPGEPTKKISVKSES